MDLYQNHLLTEGIRTIEKNSPSEKFKGSYQNLTFEDALLKRSQLAELRYQITPIFDHFKSLINLFNGLMCFIFLILGASSISQLLVSEAKANTQINFFWALLLFIVPNFLSLLLWLFLYFKSKAVNFSWVANISLWLISLLDKLQHKLTVDHSHYIVLFQYYFEHRFGRYIGRSQLSFMSHSWWSSYLVGATLSLLLVLATHQVDFIWQTTILNEDAFLWLTQLLTYLPDLLAISVPSASEVSYASISAVNSVDIAQYSRVNWSNLLIFSLVIYALVPRLILTLLFYHRIKYKQKHFRVDLSLSYYVQLKNILHPIAKTPFIKDQNNKLSKAVQQTLLDVVYNKNMSMPVNAFPIAIELAEHNFQEISAIAQKYYSTMPFNIVDRQSEQAALVDLQASQVDRLVLFVDVTRSPDRGWLTLVKKCNYKANMEIYLVLLGHEAIDKETKLFTRLQDWIEIATKAKINPQNITYFINEDTFSDPIKAANKGAKHG